MNNDNGFDLLIAVLFAMIPQLGVLGPKAQDLVVSFFLGEVQTIPQLQISYFDIRS